MSAEPTPLMRHRIESAVAELTAEFAGRLAPDTVRRFVMDTYEELERDSRVPNFLPLLVDRISKERLRAVVLLETDVALRDPQVLFVCEHNAGRSQMAAALLMAFSADAVGVWSAGHVPSERIDDHVTEVLAEVGINTRDAFPKPLLDDVVRAANVVVTMGCGDSCPVLPGKRYEDWAVPDPAGMDLDGVRRVRYDLAHRVLRLLAQIAPDVTLHPLTRKT